MKKDFINHLEKKLNLKILALNQLYGGSINQAFKITTKSCNYFIKINSDIDLFDLEKKRISHIKINKYFSYTKSCNLQ